MQDERDDKREPTSSSDKKEREPTIVIVPVYPAIPFGKRVEDEAQLDAFLVASALISWTMGCTGFLSRLINYIKIEFCEFPGGARISFKLTLKPLFDEPKGATLLFLWQKKQGIVSSPILGNLQNECSDKEKAIKAIKFYLQLFLESLARKRLSEGEDSKKAADEIGEQLRLREEL